MTKRFLNKCFFAWTQKYAGAYVFIISVCCPYNWRGSQSEVFIPRATWLPQDVWSQIIYWCDMANKNICDVRIQQARTLSKTCFCYIFINRMYVLYKLHSSVFNLFTWFIYVSCNVIKYFLFNRFHLYKLFLNKMK